MVGTTGNSATSAAPPIPPAAIQGARRPHFDRVRSDSRPTIGWMSIEMSAPTVVTSERPVARDELNWASRPSNRC